MPAGIRVVRGPDWSWGDQDGGHGGVGTAMLGTKRQDGWMDVKWDMGQAAEYRIGADDKHDIRIFDLAQAGVRHRNVTCDACGENGIKGFRWKCTQCHDYDLCSDCYYSDKHDTSHSFLRFDTPGDENPGSVQPRKQSPKLKAFGIFEGAMVSRGPDWKWGQQDRPLGLPIPGMVTEISDWTENGYNAGARVLWGFLSINLYRNGFEGEQDLRCVKPGVYGNYYPTHLPLIAISKSDIKSPGAATQLAEGLAAALMFRALVAGLSIDDDSDDDTPGQVSPSRGASAKPKRAVVPQEAADVSASMSLAALSQSLGAGGATSQLCPNIALSQIVIRLLNIHANFLKDDFDACFCEPCVKKRGDKDVYQRGKPPKVYAIPKGWVKFGLKLPARAAALKVMDEWHVAFHGTSAENVKAILEHEDLLMPDDKGLHTTIKEGKGHYREDWKPEGFNTKQVFLSPSIKYAGLPAYAKPFRFNDPTTKKERKGRIVFQVRIQPKSYKVDKETVLEDHQKHAKIDPNFSNSELEWSTTSRRVIVLTGLCVKIDS